MSIEIKVKYSELREELEILNNAIEQFKPYTDDFVTKASNKLDDFNSDFISKMQSALKNMTDSAAPELLKELNEYSKAVLSIIDKFEGMDNEMGKSFND